MKRLGPGAVTLAVCAILFGLVAAYAAKQYLTPKPKEDKTVPMLVAKFNLPQNSRITEDAVEIVRKPADQIPPNALATNARALMRVNKDAILAGQPILEAGLFPVGYSPSLSEQLPPGMRAVTFAIDPNNALAGVLMPQAVVDVALTVKGEQPELHGITTKTIMKAVKVLATSDGLFKVEERVNPALRSVTIAASPEQANKIILAQRYGTLSVVLRNANDVDTVPVSTADNDTVNPEILLGLKPIEPKPAERVIKVQAWRGGNMTEMTFKDDRVQDEKIVTTAQTPAVEPVVPVASNGYNSTHVSAGDKAKVTRGRGE